MNLCYEIGSRLYRRKARGKAAVCSAPVNEENYWGWQFKSSHEYFSKILRFDGTCSGEPDP